MVAISYFRDYETEEMKKIIDEVFDTRYTNGSYHKGLLASALIKVLEGLPERDYYIVGNGPRIKIVIDKSDIQETIDYIRKKSK